MRLLSFSRGPLDLFAKAHRACMWESRPCLLRELSVLLQAWSVTRCSLCSAAQVLYPNSVVTENVGLCNRINRGAAVGSNGKPPERCVAQPARNVPNVELGTTRQLQATPVAGVAHVANARRPLL